MFEHFIRYYDDVIEPQICDRLIEKYEQHKEAQFHVNNSDLFSFNELRILDHLDVFKDEAYLLRDLFVSAVDQYKKDCNIQPGMFPKSVGYENFRIKKYEPNGVDRFDMHVDVGDYKSARRFLVFFLYLNDVEEGGETAFGQYNLKVQPKRGRMLVFPPLWTHLHAGFKPISGPKYIVGSYLHYVDD